MKLYRSANYPTRWYSYSETAGWVMFPAEAGGWNKRQPARGIDPMHLREVPVQLTFNAGIPGSPVASAELSEAA